MIAFEKKMQAGGEAAVRHVGEFSMRTDPVHETLRTLTQKLDSLGVPYAVVGAMALSAHGYVRATTDIDVLVTADNSRLIREKLDGLGYIPPFAGSRNLRDTQTGVRIEFLITGEYPGDGKPKPIAFPDPSIASVDIDGVSYLQLEKLIELKLASGMTNINRLKDIADIQELIKAIHPPRNLADRLHEFVRSKYLELWDNLQSEPPEQ
jgi:hypothetical protein